MKWRQILIPAAVAGAVSGMVTWVVGDNSVDAALTEGPPHRAEGPLCSVIVPTLNEEDYLPGLLTTISNQTYCPIEVIVADSSDGESQKLTRRICTEFGTQYTHVSRLNISLARNEGAASASGDILLFVDADCLLSHEYIEKLILVLQDCVLVHGADPIYGNVWLGTASVFSRRWFKRTSYTTGRGVMIRAVDFWDIGGYDTGCDPMEGCREDLELGQRVLQQYGSSSICLVRDAVIATSGRREQAFGVGMWKARGVRQDAVLNGHNKKVTLLPRMEL